MARPSEYTQEKADEVCAQLAEGTSLRTVCKAEDMPDCSTIFRWIRQNEEFRKQYARAKEESADALMEETMEIADDGSNDWMERNDEKNPGYDFNGEHFQRSRLRVDVRKWAMSKLKPKKYGEKLDLTSDGERLPTPLLNAVFNNNSNPQGSETQKED